MSHEDFFEVPSLSKYVNDSFFSATGAASHILFIVYDLLPLRERKFFKRK